MGGMGGFGAMGGMGAHPATMGGMGAPPAAMGGMGGFGAPSDTMAAMGGMSFASLMGGMGAPPAAMGAIKASAGAPARRGEKQQDGGTGMWSTRALKASTRLSHLNSPTKPDAVLAFLAGLGFSRADVAAAVARNPSLLCAKVEGTLSPIVAGLTGLGLSHSEIARLASLTDYCFRTKSVVAKLRYYHHLFGSSDKLLRVLKVSPLLLSCSIGTVVQPNVAFLRECGVDVRHIASLCVNVPRLLTTNPERVRAMAACAEGVGVPRGSGMFREALQAVAFLSEEEIAAKLDYLKNTFRWSDAEVRIALSGYPSLLRRSKDMLLRKSEFLISEVGLEPAYIARLPVR
ncbi:hypothetical protein TRIUR3_11492 [Triticum urartu]|uniref:mTERF domain-containing protein 1, mitochondrial n=1 Tax=Triticum urartu TaxID=4572 RepID=M7Z9X9_TRIUA|nr:hypothetical protein TRIUR3_11492 [Triticum urartu]